MLPADGRNHKKSHRTEFNKRMGRLICGCGWKSERIGKKRAKRTLTDSPKEDRTTEEPASTFGRELRLPSPRLREADLL